MTNSTAICHCIHKNWLWFFLFISILFVYSIFWARYGLDTHDGGFILGLSKRIIEGDLPYKDFIYVRPPLTIYIHALSFLFNDYTFYFDRLLTIIEIATYSFVSAYLIFKFTEKKDFIGFATVIIFIFSIHNFPMFGWHTVDAIFFSTIGVLLYGNRSFLTAGIFFFLAVLCKQNFIVIVLFFILLSYFKDKLLPYIKGLFLAVTLFYFYLYCFDLKENFVEQVFSQGSINDILKSGFLGYIIAFYNKKTMLVLLVSLLFSFRITKTYNLKLNDFLIVFHTTSLFLFSATFFTRAVTNSGENYSFFMVTFDESKALLVTAFFAVFFNKQYRDQKIYSLFLISWCSSISWGYAVPALFMAPCILPIFMLSTGKIKENLVLIFLLVLAILSFFSALAYPYGESARYDTFVDVPEFMHKVRFLKTSPEKLRKWNQVREITEQYSKKNIVILPGFTQFDSILNRKPISILDWEINAEIPNKLQSKVYDSICKENVIALIEKETINIILNNPDYGKERFDSILSKKVFSDWSKIDEKKYFIIYSPLKIPCSIEIVK